MTSSIEQHEHFNVLTVGYETIDTTTIRQFRRDLDDAVAGIATLVVDLAHVRFIDSSGLGALLSAQRRLAAAGGDLRLCELTPQVRTLFELVRLHRVFDIANTRADALVQGALVQ
jgi:anti-sigma B factor antagonist